MRHNVLYVILTHEGKRRLRFAMQFGIPHQRDGKYSKLEVLKIVGSTRSYWLFVGSTQTFDVKHRRPTHSLRFLPFLSILPYISLLFYILSPIRKASYCEDRSPSPRTAAVAPWRGRGGVPAPEIPALDMNALAGAQVSRSTTTRRHNMRECFAALPDMGLESISQSRGRNGLSTDFICAGHLASGCEGCCKHRRRGRKPAQRA